MMVFFNLESYRSVFLVAVRESTAVDTEYMDTISSFVSAACKGGGWLMWEPL